MTEIYPGADQDEKDGYIHDTVPAKFDAPTSNQMNMATRPNLSPHTLRVLADVWESAAKDLAAQRDQALVEVDRLRDDLKRIVEYQSGPAGSFEYVVRRLAMKSLACETPPSRSIQRRIAAQRGEPAPEFEIETGPKP